MAQKFNVFKMFEKMDTNLTKFYSSKTSNMAKDNRCGCIDEK